MTDAEIEGFKPITISPVTTKGEKRGWLRLDLLTEDGKICGESKDHWVTCYSMAGELSLAGYTNISVNNWGDQGDEDADITCTSPLGESIWIEYERPGTHSIRQIGDKKKNQINKCDVWLCVHQKTNQKEVISAVGPSFCAMRGAEFEDFIQKFGTAQ